MDGLVNLQQHFEAQVEQNPQRIAVVSNECTLSYAEVNQRANQLAHYLLEKGLQSDALVAVFLERSADFYNSYFRGA